MPFIQEPVLTGTWPFASPERRTLRSIDIRFSSWYVALFLSDIVSHRRLLFWMRSNFEPNVSIDPQLLFERLLDCGEVARLLHLDPKTVERLSLARPTRSSIRNLLHVLFNHAVEYEWLVVNPITLVRQSGKRTRVPVILEIGQMGSLLSKLGPLERTAVLLAASTGLRISELLALKWKDVDFLGKEMHVTRAIYRQVVGRCKTENSQKPMPLDNCALQDLLAWWQLTPFKGSDDWVFASARRAGRQPCWPDSLLQKRVRPAAHKAGIKVTIGWHTFRRSFSSWLKANGADLKVVQELMRHANLRTTMELYTQAPMGAKREAQKKIAEQIALVRA